MICPICGASPSDECTVASPDRLHGVPGTFCIAVCASCGAGWTLPRATPDELASFYPESYAAHLLEGGVAGVVQRIGQRLILARAFERPPLSALAEVPVGNILDVGCGRGDLGSALVRRGWHVAGVDPSSAACEVARSRGVDARVGTLETVGYEHEAFDAVVMNHSLEHVPDPRGELSRVHGIIRPGGLLLISVPNFGCWQRRLFGSRWFPLDPPRHRTHFTVRSLELALSNAGFDVLSIEPMSDSATLVASLQYVLAGRLILWRRPWGWMTYALQAFLSPFNALVDRRRHDGGAFVSAIAVRPAAAPADTGRCQASSEAGRIPSAS